MVVKSHRLMGEIMASDADASTQHGSSPAKSIDGSPMLIRSPSPCGSDISVGCPSPLNKESVGSPCSSEPATPSELSAGRSHPLPGFSASETGAETENSEDLALSDDEYFKPLKKLRMVRIKKAEQNTQDGLKSFSIMDILEHRPAPHRTPDSARIVRPWDMGEEDRRRRRVKEEVREKCNTDNKGTSPLDALFQMTSKTFEGLQSGDADGSKADQLMFNNRQQAKKKRKSRTAFTNHQIFELEKRFLYQKYLSPADRDEIAQSLGLTNAQVITWFQNRRAKLKRDMEELKKDVESVNILSAHKSYMTNMQKLGLAKIPNKSSPDK